MSMLKHKVADMYSYRLILCGGAHIVSCAVCGDNLVGKCAAQVGRWWVSMEDVVNICDFCRPSRWAELEVLIYTYNDLWLDTITITDYFKEVL